MKKQVIKMVLNGAILVTLLAAMTQTVSAKGSPLPDATSTGVLVSVGCAGLVAIRKFLR